MIRWHWLPSDHSRSVASFGGDPEVGLRGQPVFVFFFPEKPDRAGGSEFAVNLRILTLQTLFAQSDFMFHAPVTGFFA
jgi:hypothetical protein